MKKIMHSRVIKSIAVILVIVYCAIGAYQITDLAMWDMRSTGVYQYEGSFGNSVHVWTLLHSVEWEVDRAFAVSENGEAEQSVEERLSALEESLSRLSSEGRILYYVAINDRVITNYNGEHPEELCGMKYFKRCEITESGAHMETTLNEAVCGMDTERFLNGGMSVLVISALTPSYADGAQILWSQEEGQFLGKMVRLLLCVFLFFVFFVYLVMAAGKDREGKEKRSWVDLIFVEVHLAIIAGAFLLAALVFSLLLDGGSWLNDRIWVTVSLLSGAVAGMLALLSSLSLVRKIKQKQFLKTSAVAWILKGILFGMRFIGKGIGKCIRSLSRALGRTVFKKHGMIFCTFLLIYTAVIAICGIFCVRRPMGVIVGVLVFFVGCCFLAYRGADLDEVKRGIEKIRAGDFSHQIPPLKCEDLRQMSEDLSGIAEGMEKAVSERVRAERMKSELITNVSHDLKTPLTSIINYTELLSEMETLPSEARDYVTVISRKSERLKRLTQDLFDVSRAQSGNETATVERLEAGVLVEQALSEYEREIEGSGLMFCVESEKGLYFNGDGRKLSRVIGNLIENILKYTLRGTRVFVRVKKREGQILMEFKNISSYPLNVDPEELVGRFVRADSSRSTEGNGLGLAIAKAYTELCGGRFEITVDGDLFGAILYFDAV